MMAALSLLATLATTAAAVTPLDVPATHFFVDGVRPPGTLLLNMLIKDEEVHLARTLPKWARIIDAWIIGVDDNNTDRSREVIARELGHIPGKIMTVHFDGMGPTWTQLVEAGWEAFPHVTHGILADADFAPMTATIDKRELDITCSKHLFTIYTADHSNKRKLDWIYRNMPGVRVSRRTHQALEAPPLPQQGMYITEVPSLTLDEQPGGYQDRTGGAKGKARRYIEMLESDLQDFGPTDSRSLYYIGIGYLDLFHAALREQGYAGLAAEDWGALRAAVVHLRRRVALHPGSDVGRKEERWFALIKLGEVHERYLGEQETALRFYLHAARLDAERADAWFYAGQNLRLRGRSRAALPLLLRAATLAQPDRALFHWGAMYTCLPQVDLARAASAEAQNASALFVAGADACRQPPTAAGGEAWYGGNDGQVPNENMREAVACTLAPLEPSALRSADEPTHEAVVSAATAPAEVLARYLEAAETLPLSPLLLDFAASRAVLAAGACRAGGEATLGGEAEAVAQSLAADAAAIVQGGGGSRVVSAKRWRRTVQRRAEATTGSPPAPTVHAPAAATATATAAESAAMAAPMQQPPGAAVPKPPLPLRLVPSYLSRRTVDIDGPSALHLLTALLAATVPPPPPATQQVLGAAAAEAHRVTVRGEETWRRLGLLSVLLAAAPSLCETQLVAQWTRHQSRWLDDAAATSSRADAASHATRDLGGPGVIAHCAAAFESALPRAAEDASRRHAAALLGIDSDASGGVSVSLAPAVASVLDAVDDASAVPQVHLLQSLLLDFARALQPRAHLAHELTCRVTRLVARPLLRRLRALRGLSPAVLAVPSTAERWAAATLAGCAA